jgi:hypothetical protein
MAHETAVMSGMSSPNPLFRNDDLPVARAVSRKAGRNSGGDRRGGSNFVRNIVSLLFLCAIAGGVFIMYTTGVFGQLGVGGDAATIDPVPDRDILADVPGLITVEFEGTVSEEVTTAFRQAALFWNSIITDDFGTVRYRATNMQKQTGCEKYELGDQLPGIQISASTASVDGKVRFVCFSS